MSALIERLRAALGGEYDVLDELARGGMGVVFRARDLALDRLVAIKIIQPGIATAAAAERFLREARLLATFRHPNIVPVHRAGEADGLPYYVMDCLEGETLATRLSRGPLPPTDALAVADDLLAALEAVHAHGIVHRDIKPANIFLVNGRAVLGDFGISKAPSSGAPTLTAPGHIVGTPAYMPPEQLAGGDVTPRTDVCAAGLVIFEAFTGRPWSFDSLTRQADWKGVPPAIAPAVRRALAWAPGDRFRSADEFRRALSGRVRRPIPRVVAGLAAAILLIAVVWKVWPRSPVPAEAVRVQIEPLRAEGGTPQELADSLAARLLRSLRVAADIDFQPAPVPKAELTVDGSVRVLADTVRASLRAKRTGHREPLFEESAVGTRASVMDSAAHQLLLAIWNTRDSTFRDLPVQALPQSATGLAMWAQAEALYARGQWTAAFKAYQDAARTDSTCALCALRLITITRWLRQSPDTALTARVRRSISAFTPQYQDLIRAGMDTVDRWRALEKMVARAPRFDLGHFIYGDELFHRGALAGRSRALAMQEFQTVVELRPHFAPAWEHLTWIAIAQGDSDAAVLALRKYETEAAPDDPETFLKRAVFHVGFDWRFSSATRAEQTTEFVLKNPLIGSLPDLRVAGTYLLVFDAPDGVVWLGRKFARWPGRAADLRAPGLVAQIVGYLASGRADSARTVMRRLAGESAEPEYALLAAEFETALVMFDSLDAPAAWTRLEPALGAIARTGAATALQRRRAAWMLTLLARRAHQDERAWRLLVAREPAPAPFSTLLDADLLAATQPRLALQHTRRLLALDSAGRAGDPFFRSALHLLRADWQLRNGDPGSAEGELLWYGNYDVDDQPSAPVQAADVDWSFGTLARWRRALIARTEGGRELCRDLADVARLWALGDPRYKARAGTARARYAALRCASAP